MTAGEVFARRGFRDATVREISTLAGANLAAVNYHFGDKKGLYSAVIACGLTSGEAFPPAEFAIEAPAEEKLRAYCRAFVRKILDHRKPEWHSKLMAREMAEPTEALDEMVEMMIRPHWERLSGIVSEILGVATSPELVRVATRSITAQMVFFVHARPVLERLFPGEPWSPASIDERGDEVAAFSLAALDTLRRSGGTR
ncbi:MAG: CerR family C-terminal domain-containing protein [Phycisphaerales bacterium]|jgi:AcrR family transcriptional regulator